jgi:hypothetical protein
MSVLQTRAYRVLRQRGFQQFCRDGVAHAAKQRIEPRLRGAFADRALEEAALAERCAADGTFFRHYDTEEIYTLDLPTMPGGYVGDTRNRMLETYCSGMTIDAPYVCALSDATLVGPDAVTIKDGGYVFETSLESIKRLSTSCLGALADGTAPIKSRWLHPDRQFDTVISLVGPWTNNYTHWFQDYLARLEGLEYYRAKTGSDPDILIPANASGWMRDALQAVGYGPERWIEWNGGRASVDQLIVSSIRREARHRAPNRRIVYSPTSVRWITNRIKTNIEPEQTVPHSNRVYISRSNALTRRVRNEDEVMVLLDEWGFERYHPEELSFAEQVTLFSNADAIVAPHGSGLMNQIFADEAVVIELMGKKQTVTSPATEYYYAELLGHNYGCVPGDAVGADLKTNISGLSTVLQKLLEES